MSFPEQIQAILMTGGRVKKMPASEPNVPSKGYIDVGGHPMAARTLRALVAAKRISRITLVTPLHPNALEGEWSGASTSALAKDSLFGSLYSGLETMQDCSDPVLLVGGDLPFLTPEAVDDFVERCSKHDEASIWYGFLSKENSEAKYPTLRHTWAKLDGKKFCGTGLVGMRPSITPAIKGPISAITQGRKSVPHLAKTLGITTLLRLVLGFLQVKQAEVAMSRLMQVPCAAIESPFAETAFNIDDYESLLLARKLAE